MNAVTTTPHSLSKTLYKEQKPSIWQRMFDAWVRSYEARVSADGKVLFVGL